MKDPQNQVQRRINQYWYVDGLTEFSFGLVCLILGLYFFAEAALPEDSSLANLLNMFFVLIVIGGTLLAGHLQGYLKSRITFPRTGYVQYKQRGLGYRLMGALLAALIASLAAGLLAATPVGLAWMPAVTGILLSLALLYFGFRIGLPRFFTLSLVSLLAGAGLAFSGLENLLALAWYYVLLCLALFISGGITLYQYLKSTSAGQ